MIVIVNGVEEERDCADLLALWEEHSAALDIESPTGFAIALNGRLVRRPQWRETTIQAGDRIEIVRAFAGG